MGKRTGVNTEKVYIIHLYSQCIIDNDKTTLVTFAVLAINIPIGDN